MKKKRINKTREEVLKDLKSNSRFVEKMKFTKEEFYPALLKASKSIDDASSFLSSINNIMMEKFLGYMKEKNFGELKLGEMLDPKDEKYEELKAMLALFDNKSIFEAKEYVEGMRNEISLFLGEEAKERSLSSLKTKWLDELTG